jgi:hypothetical protein
MKMKFIPTSGRLITALALILGLTAAPPASATPGQPSSKGEEFHYRYVSLGSACPVSDPSLSFFDPVAIVNGGQIYGNLYTCSDVACLTSLIEVAVCAHGTLTALQAGLVHATNNGGTVGGSVLIDPLNYIEQAALFRKDHVELIAPQPGEYTSFVTALNDSGMALVTSYDATSFQPTFLLYKNGQSTPLDFLSTFTQPDFLKINNQGTISGTDLGAGRGFRFDTRTGETTQLNPLPTETYAWAVGINKRGDVLGWSFKYGSMGMPYIERVGVWNRKGEFTTYVVEGSNSSRLVFNDDNLIVITDVRSPAAEAGNSYLVPKPGVRLNLADLVENLPAQQIPSYILDINNHGDMIGYSERNFTVQDIFLLERIGGSKMH